MKARQHLIVNFFILAILLAILIWFGFSNYILSNILFFGYGIALFLLGAILPDSDSNDKGSYIYHQKWLWILAHFISWLEYPLMTITHRKKGHRESLHTILGIVVTSLFTMIIFLILGLFFFHKWYIGSHLFGLGCLFLGQFAHLLGDCQKSWRPSFK